MEKRQYTTTIDADRAHVWRTLIAPDTYHQWVRAFSEGSRFEGRWAQGETVRFVDPQMGGTEAVLEIFQPHECIRARHLATVSPDGRVDTDSEGARQWIGTTETYRLSTSQGTTTLTIEMETHAAFVEMFDTCWPDALARIKALAEAPGAAGD